MDRENAGHACVRKAQSPTHHFAETNTDEPKSILTYVPISRCVHYRNHYHHGRIAGLIISLSLTGVVQALCVMTRINELGLLPPGLNVSQLNNAVRHLRTVVHNWGVVSMEELLFSVARHPSGIRFKDNRAGSPTSIVQAITNFDGFPYVPTNSEGGSVKVSWQRLEQGRLLMEALMDIATLLPTGILPAAGPPADAAGHLISSIKEHRTEWDRLKNVDCDCGAV